MTPLPSVADIVGDPLQYYPAATAACFDATRGELPRRSLDAAANQRFLEQLGDCGVPAVLIGASTGHGHLRTTAELGQWIEASAAAALPATVKMVLLRPEDPLAESRRLLQLAAAGDYRVAFLRPGTDLPADADDRTVADNLRPLLAAAAAAELAVGLYSIPDVSGLPLRPAVVASLLEAEGGDRIVAVKVTEADYDSSTRQFLNHPALQQLKIVQGWDPHLARALQDGGRRCGVTSGPMSFAVHQYQHLLQAAQDSQWAEVLLAQQAVTELFQAMQDDPQKFADLQRAKYIMGLGHPLLGAVSDAQADRVLHALARVSRPADRQRLARSLDLMGEGPYHARLQPLVGP